LDNQHIVRSDVVAEGSRFFHLEPKINLDIVKRAKLEGIPHEQMLGLFRCMGIYVGKSSNMLKQATKVKAAIKHTEERLIENQKEHVEMTRADKNYHGDVVWEKDGNIVHSTCSRDVCIDGADCTCFFNHRHQGKQSAFIITSIMTGKPFALVVSKVSNIDDDSVASKLLSYLTISLSTLDILY
jgi:hypothetical protein